MGFVDVTSIVQAQAPGTTKTYTMTNLTVDNTGNYFNYQGTVATWSLVVFYRAPSIVDDYKIVLYDGLEVFYNGSTSVNSSGTYTLDGFEIGTTGDGEMASIIYEGDAHLQNSETYCTLNVAGACASMDYDVDGIPNYLDTDSDNDGCSDANEGYQDPNADGGDNEYYGLGAPPPTDTLDGTVIAAAYNGTDPSYLDELISNMCGANCSTIYTNGFLKYNRGE